MKIKLNDLNEFQLNFKDAICILKREREREREREICYNCEPNQWEAHSKLLATKPKRI